MAPANEKFSSAFTGVSSKNAQWGLICTWVTSKNGSVNTSLLKYQTRFNVFQRFSRALAKTKRRTVFKIWILGDIC